MDSRQICHSIRLTNIYSHQQLNADHPDWYLHVPGRPRQLGRNQMVLDLSRDVVRDYLFNAISLILSELVQFRIFNNAPYSTYYTDSSS